MELFIETLTGTAFELRVSPFETIMSVKAKIQRLEGIPISHQHLIWQSVELEDDYCLHDYSIHSGATLKLVLAMRGGPINTRRIPMEDPALREMAEYMEANKDEILEKLPGNRHVTLLVFRDGDQLNFFRVVDRGDGTLTPLSESLSASMYNYNEEEDDEEQVIGAHSAENDKLKDKMQQLRVNMEKLSLTKKHKIPKPPPPGSEKPSSSSSRMRLRQLSMSGRTVNKTFNKNTCLPPVGQTFQARVNQDNTDSDDLGPVLSSSDDNLEESGAMAEIASFKTTIDTFESKLNQPLDRVKEDTGVCDGRISAEVAAGVGSDSGSASVAGSSIKRDLYRLSSLTEPSTSRHFLTSSARRRECNFEMYKESLRPSLSSKSRKQKCDQATDSKDLHKRISSSAKKEISIESLRDSLMRQPTTSRYGSRKEFQLESLTTSEACSMSGLLRQASIEKIGTSHIANFVSTSAGKSRLGNYNMAASSQEGCIPTPENRMVSARLQRISASRDGLISPTHRLPPVKAKKKNTRRCYLCGKKTGLATSYQCRCGDNFCATHRYAESHDCRFDYKTEGKKLLEQNNPVVNAPKLPKI
ncbi:AN1-type zinc finger protein 4 [Patella vulgata]|uniref:AN1-type zinc finger protein 4 n=1 Tax=Patella vulgata TaxID=6465 RepID=UPI00218055EC|nr:AN1-type zinc finger protein 4 [Patella vulgata]